ncbi:hypothetical protein BLOT_003860 [Blomia tropicalis]|nr:hypothetical protein BLOT_003860 [Blomia tropicalis]
MEIVNILVNVRPIKTKDPLPLPVNTTTARIFQAEIPNPFGSTNIYCKSNIFEFDCLLALQISFINVELPILKMGNEYTMLLLIRFISCMNTIDA